MGKKTTDATEVAQRTLNGLGWCALRAPAIRFMNQKSGRGERIRTSGLYVPNVALYQAKLHPDGALDRTHEPLDGQGF